MLGLITAFFYALLEFSDASLVSVPILLCGLSMGPLSLLIGELLHSPDQATFAVPLFVFIFMLPGALYFDLAFEIQRSFFVEAFLSLSPPSALTLALRNLCRQESLRLAGSWHFTAFISNVPFYVYSVILLIDYFFYTLFLVVYLEWFRPNIYLKNIRCNGRSEEEGLLSEHVIVNVHELTKRYGKSEVLTKISTHLSMGEVTVLLGSNGAGKTTLMRILAGFDHDFEGSVKMSDNHESNRRKIGWCPQSDALWSHLTMREHIQIYAALLHLPQRELFQALGRLEMWPHLEKASRKLSGGLKRRLSLVLAYAGEPAFVCIDEATTGCDYAARELMRQEILCYHTSTSTLISTHHIDDIEVISRHYYKNSFKSYLCF